MERKRERERETGERKAKVNERLSFLLLVQISYQPDSIYL